MIKKKDCWNFPSIGNLTLSGKLGFGANVRNSREAIKLSSDQNSFRKPKKELK